MKRKNITLSWLLVSLGGLLLLSGCMKSCDYLKTEFPQAQKQTVERQTLASALASVSVYDEFETKAHFDVLWLSDMVREKHAAILARLQGSNQAALRGMIRRALGENEQALSFYILADVRGDDQTQLTDDNPLWRPVLETEKGELVRADSIKSVDLEPSWQALFGPKFNQYKKAYLVKFPLKDVRGVLVRPNEEPFTLSMRSVHKHVQFTFGWTVQDGHSGVRVGQTGKFLPDEDFYWV